MSETKPEKLLVSKGKYVRVMGQKIVGYTLAAFVACLGLFPLVGMLLVWTGLGDDMPVSSNERAFFVVFWFSVTCFIFVCAKRQFTKTKSIESVQPITDHNAHLLPAQETLLRGSDLSPTVQQAELLRATQSGQETPQEELLRATTGEE